jgi:hypothetical protein
VIADGIVAGAVDPAADATGADSAVDPGLVERLGLSAEEPNPSIAARAILAWTTLFGLISFELFGHTNNVVIDHERYFDDAVERLGTMVGLP